jgi:hypothetical protein
MVNAGHLFRGSAYADVSLQATIAIDADTHGVIAHCCAERHFNRSEVSGHNQGQCLRGLVMTELQSLMFFADLW